MMLFYVNNTKITVYNATFTYLNSSIIQIDILR